MSYTELEHGYQGLRNSRNPLYCEEGEGGSGCGGGAGGIGGGGGGGAGGGVRAVKTWHLTNGE